MTSTATHGLEAPATTNAIERRCAGERKRGVCSPAMDDLRHAIRTLRRSPTFTLVTILILTLGIGANTAIFSVLNAVMLRSLPVRAPGELVHLLSVYPGEPRNHGFPWLAYEHYRENNHVFSDLIAVAPATFQATFDGGEGETAQGQYVSGNFFPALGVQPVLGRLIEARDDVVGAAGAANAVLSWTTWQTRFGGDPAILGRAILLDNVPVTILGVAPRAFSGVITGYAPTVWLPAAAEAQLKQPGQRASGMLPVAIIGRMRPVVTIGEAQAEMRVLDRWRVEQMAQRSKDSQVRQIRMDVEPAGAGINPMRDRVAGPLLVIMAIVGLLLLLTCANLASMLLARAAARRRELAVRLSLGASPLRLVRQSLAESLLLSITGGVAGIFVGIAGARALARIFTSGRMPPGLAEWTIAPGADLNVLLFAVTASVLTGVLFGLAPAWQAFTAAPMTSLRDRSTSDPPSRRLWARGLVVAQVALSLVVLSAAALFARHLSNLRTVDVGFESDSVLLVSLDPGRSGQKPRELSHLYQQLLDRLQGIAGVQSATLSGVTPIHGAGASRFVNVEGKAEDPAARRFVAVNWVAPKYFETFGTPLIDGRDFTRSDESAPPVAIINKAMARHYFGAENPLHRHFTFDGMPRRYEIVGVVADAKYYNLHEAPPRTVYLNDAQDAPGRNHQFALRTTVPPLSVAPAFRQIVQETVKGVAIRKIITFEDQVNASLVNERLISLLSTVFGVLAMVLATVGLYGLLAFTVTRRTSEIGVRMALGATPGDVIRLVLGSAVGLVSAGLLLGVPFAFWCRRVAAGLIPNLPDQMTASVLVAAAALLAAAALAAYVPARRATRVDPVEALRHS